MVSDNWSVGGGGKTDRGAVETKTKLEFSDFRRQIAKNYSSFTASKIVIIFLIFLENHLNFSFVNKDKIT